jgi:hypothetical protein
VLLGQSCCVLVVSAVHLLDYLHPKEDARALVGRAPVLQFVHTVMIWDSVPT